MKKRIICDTCSAIKLASFNSKFFKSSALTQGDLILHPAIFSEIRKWKPEKKDKYKKQIEILDKISSTKGLRPNKVEFESQEIIIKSTRDSLGLSVGRMDIEQLVSIILYDLDLITNDSPFCELAEAFEVNVYEAEETVIEGINQGLVTISEVQLAIDEWENNGEKQPSKSVKKQLIKVGIKYP